MAKKTIQQVNTGPVKLLIPREDAEERLRTRIERGKGLLARAVHSEGELRECWAEYRKWSDYNNELLTRIFSDSSVANDYSRVTPVGVFADRSFSEKVEDFRRSVASRVEDLESISERLELIPVAANSFSPSRGFEKDNVRVFIVHGHDDRARETVARFVERLGLEAVILHEQANAGRTIIEKFETHADVGFAVVLLTPDDVGAAREFASALKDRARQNVIFELGFFCGRLGREHVCALYSEGVELPSDIQGLVYIPMDDGEGWHLRLAKELRQAGLPVDLNRAI